MSHQSELIATDIDAYLKQHERKQMLRFLTCGSVDDGKSTLIGRLLYDSKMVYEDQMAAVEVDSKKFGTTGGEFDPALLTDGLRAEREQGITIDVAYRYFSTTKRKFIIADTPGHEQYTRNMATGASMCDLAIILIDARHDHGVMEQTRRHSFIASLLGIRHIVVAVNKMDIVDYSQQRFDEICADYSEFASKLVLPDVRFVPIAALLGDNVVNKSEHMDWYEGPTLMHILDNVHIASDRNLIDLRFPVQYVNRPDLNFRGYSGTVASGTVRPGDEVMVLPSRKTSRVKSIVTFDGEVEEATPPMAPTITLEDEIDISRGDVLVHPNNLPRVGDAFEAMVVWMAEEPMLPGKPYLIKHGTKLTPGRVDALRYRMDVNTLHRHDTEQLELNAIGRCMVKLSSSVAYDPYVTNRSTGAFVIIDRLTHNTVGAGMILDREPTQEDTQRLAAARTPFLQTQDSLISPQQRAAGLGHKPATVWLTGLTGSGKSAVAYALERRLFDEGRSVAVLDGSNVRQGLSSDLSFADQDRTEHIRRSAQVAKTLNDAGSIVVCSYLSPGEADRALAREIVGGTFAEVYMNAPLDVCRERTGDDMYAKAEAGEIDHVSGVNSPYEAPQSPELDLASHELTTDECVDRIMAWLSEQGVFEV